MARAVVSDDEDRPVGLILHLLRVWKDALLTPFRLLTSKFAIKAYITSLLYVGTALALFALAIAAYTTFYWTYIPRIGFERTLHLQFDPISPECLALDSPLQSAETLSRCTQYPHPWATVNLKPDLVSQQRYDIAVILSMPRTPTNTQVGNFMVDAALLAPSSPIDTIKSGLMLTSDPENDRILAHSRRPAMMTYYSKEVELMHKTTQLHWFFLGWRKEAETLRVSLFEGVEFDKGWRNVPSTMRLEVQTQRPQSMQFYEAKVMFRARFRGLRWIMYNHRLLSAAVFITAFWGTEMIFASAAWVVLSWIIFGQTEEDDANARTKKEYDTDFEDEGVKMSETERSFPTYGSQPPLRYTSPVKKEDTSPTDLLRTIPPVLPSGDADVSDEDGDFVLDDAERWRDSGLGTSLESSGPGRNEALRRRRSKTQKGAESL